MIDFLMISTRTTKNGVVEIYPKFVIKRSTDLMIRGGDFYAIWLEDRGMWSTNEQDAIDLIDRELTNFAEEYRKKHEVRPKVLHMWDAESGMIDSWHKYCQRQSRDNYHMLDEKLIFMNMPPSKKDYASRRLPYPIEEGDCPAFKRLISTLYTEEERHKIEWAIGSIVTGDSKTIQKFMVLYGAAGTGKSTILNIIQQLFEGYYVVFDAKALGSASSTFALEPFKTNPLVAIQHDGDLSKIEDNTRLNSLVSHEEMTINEKFKSTYSNRFKCFLFMGTNRPVKITDAKSGLLRRLIDVTPSGDKLSPKDYKTLTQQISFELGAIANYCKEVYLSDPGRYDDYVPTAMLGASNDFYNFVVDSYHIFLRDDGTTVKAAWEMYRVYCEDAKVPYPFSQRTFKEELKNYFREFDQAAGDRGIYTGFKTDIFETDKKKKKKTIKHKLIEFDSTDSIFDQECADCPAQYASASETPQKKWESVKTTLSSLKTTKLHYVQVPDNHIVIDFDIPDESGNKCFEKNLEEASKWPATYAELSKSGQGIHLHYIYTGDPTKLSRVYGDHIEVKVFTGNSSLRRKLTKCNNLPIASISSGLPLKEGDKVINFEGLKNEKALRTVIKKNLNKEIHDSTKCSVDFIYKILQDAYESGMKYDVSDLRNSVYAFAANSTNQADFCLKLVSEMKFKSDEPSANIEEEAPIVFYDVEVFPNLFLVNWKFQGEDKPIVRMINPKPSDIEGLLKYRLIGFNNRRYDNHILYGCLIGYTNEQLFELSQKIVGAKKGASNNGLFGEAYNLSYTDIYDFASAGNKQSLKKWEIELGIHHQELGLPWDKPVPEDQWTTVAEYCDNDVIATEALFNHLQADWTARQILADLADMTVNDTTNTLTTRIIFGTNRKPQNEFCYRDMSKRVKSIDPEVEAFLNEACPDMMVKKTPMMLMTKKEESLLPYFPGYKYEAGVSTYRGEEVGEGGYVYAEHGMHYSVALLDIASMHPHSAIAECLFGPRYTRAFRDIVTGRVDIKHEAWDIVNEILDGKLAPFVKRVINGELTSDQLADALKTAINSCYGLTSASFDNPFRDPRNKDNIVAKRGALFMIDLKHEVQARGFTVAHIKTDSIKIPNATPEIIKFVMDFGKAYGYTFEHEATYEKMCLVNNAVYIAKYASVEWTEQAYGYIPTKQKKKAGKWDATGKQFAVPYVFKKLFSDEPIEFKDMCETMSVTTALYLDMNENLPEGEHNYQFIGRVGSFCPIKPGCGGGELLREGTDKDGNVKYSAATGSKGFRWMESEMVKTLNKEKDIDRSYYDKLVDDAVDTISQYGDIERFIADDTEELFNPGDLPWNMECGRENCLHCPNLEQTWCKAGYDNSAFLEEIEGDAFRKR